MFVGRIVRHGVTQEKYLVSSSPEHLTDLRRYAMVSEERQAHSGRRLDFGQLSCVVEAGGDVSPGEIRELLDDLLG